MPNSKTQVQTSNFDSQEHEQSTEEFRQLLEEENFSVPQVGETVQGVVISASKAEVKLDIDGVMIGVVRGPELYEEDEEYANLKPGDQVEATVIDGENENNELELSFKFAGQEKAWQGLRDAYAEQGVIKVKVADANKGGLMVKYRQIPGFLPVSQLAPENYPRVNGGDKGKILERLRAFAGQEIEVKVITLDERDDKIIFSEKEAWNEKQQDVIAKYKQGTVVEGVVTAITDFGLFVSFGENLEGLIHISELAWQRIDDPADLYSVGDTIKAEVIGVEDSKIFLSAKKLMKDPWQDVDQKYKVGDTVQGEILKVNPFGLFVKLDEDIHGLAHVSQLGLGPKEKISDKFKNGQTMPFEIVSMEPKEHRLGLAYTQATHKATDQEDQGPAEEGKKPDKEKPAEETKPEEEKKTE
jgi:small subunit ribosomal protein S1